jgi:hypothetical protein
MLPIHGCWSGSSARETDISVDPHWVRTRRHRRGGLRYNEEMRIFSGKIHVHVYERKHGNSIQATRCPMGDGAAVISNSSAKASPSSITRSTGPERLTCQFPVMQARREHNSQWHLGRDQRDVIPVIYLYN